MNNPSEGSDKRIITGGSDRGEARIPSGQSINDFHGRSDVDSSIFAQHHTIGTSRTQAAAGNHTHDGVSSSFVSLIRRTTADQSKWGTQNVQEDITGLFVDLEANAYYVFEGLIHAQGTVDLNMGFAFTAPASATMRWSNNSVNTAVAAGSIDRQSLTSLAPATPVIPVDTGLPVLLIPVGTVFSGVGGRFQIRMQKLVATAGTVTVFANSTLEVKKIAA